MIDSGKYNILNQYYSLVGCCINLFWLISKQNIKYFEYAKYFYMILIEILNSFSLN